MASPAEPVTTDRPERSFEPCVAWTWNPTWPTKPPRKTAAGPGRVSLPSSEPRSTPKVPGSRRIDVLQRVVWPLIFLLAVPVFGLLYRVLTTAPG